MTNIFTIHTPLQHLLTGHMVRNMPEFSKSRNFLVLDIEPDKLNIDKSLWEEVILLDPIVGRYFIGSGKNCRRAVKTIASLVDPFENVALFVSDVEWPLNNALYGLARSRSKDNVQICNFPDGLGSLLVRYPRPKRLLRNIAKKIIGLFGGLPYYLYPGDIMGLVACDKVYTNLPEALPDDINDTILPIPPFKAGAGTLIPNSVIFLGQSFDYDMPENEYRKMVIKSRDYILSQGFEKKYYKPHYFFKTDIDRKLFKEGGFELIEDHRPVEELFTERRFSCVASYSSSALVHLKMMYGDEIRSIACYKDWASNFTSAGRASIETTTKVFNLVGVEIVT